MLESRRRSIIFFFIAIILAGLAGFLVLKKVQTINDELGQMVPIFVANSEIMSRTILVPNDVTTEEIPKKYLRDEHITDANDLANKVSVIPLSPGEVITKNILKEASDVTEEGNRLVSILSGSNVFFDEQLSALDRVDIIVSHELTEDEELVTEVFMEDVKVARVAQSEGRFSGVQLEVSFEEAPALIHMHNFATRLRIIKSNVSQSGGGIVEQGPGEEGSQVEDLDEDEEIDNPEEDIEDDEEDDRD